jgi:adenine phosphoribosyltransferase
VWRVFTDASALAAVVEGLADPWRGAGVTHVLGIESRGFLLGSAVAVNLGVGFLAVRKEEGLLPGPKLSVTSEPDYRGRVHQLRMQQTLGPGDVALLVDDWAEKGAQASAVRQLVEMTGAGFAGVSVAVDQLDDSTRHSLGLVTALVRFEDLESPDAG